MYRQRLILFLAVCLTATAAIVGLRPVTTVPITSSADFWSAKTHLGDSAYDLVLVGDSRLLMGVSPAAMREALPGREILNFGYLGAGLTSDFIEAAIRKLDPDADEPLLVVSVTPLSLSSRSLPNKHFKQELHRPASASLGASGSKGVLGEVRRAFEPFEPFAHSPIVPDSVSRFREAGWIASDSPPEKIQVALQSYTRHFKSGKFDAANFERFLGSLKKAAASGIEVLAFRHPSSPAMEALENRISGFREAYVRKRLADAGVTWLPLKGTRGRTAKFASYDGSHLSAQGAVAFSAVLARKIAAHP
ncbi:MAG: hypothetical protein VX246_12900 [Myxococcota bacterium]|nr:hypothetical protein [Myxococcota bacterium]